jgi:error-prone DNA polymerase
VAGLAARCPGAGETLELLAWAGACDALVEGGRREALWQLGVVAPAAPSGGGRQLALALEPGAAPELPALTPWERMVADYSSTKVTLEEHPLELLRPRLPADVLSSAELERERSGNEVRVAGLVVARQRPATARGMTFMLLEDEHATINLIVPPPIHDRDRLAVRAEPLVLASGRLERREGTTNVVVDSVERLERPDLPQAEVKHIEPRRAWSTEGRADDLRTVAPAAHSFGRRGR